MAKARRQDEWRNLGHLKAIVEGFLSGEERSIDDYDPYADHTEQLMEAPLTALRDVFCQQK